MRRTLVTAATLVALAAPGDAAAAQVFLFDRTSAEPNERVTISATTAARAAVRLYLVRTDEAGGARNPRAARLTFVGTLAPGRGLSFSVPPLDAATYALASWCPSCSGAPFSVQRPERLAPGNRAKATLRIAITSACPVTLPNGNRPLGQPRKMLWYGNGRLWAGLHADGTRRALRAELAADGSIGDKLLWVTTPRLERPTISGERIDEAGPPLRVLRVNRGSFSGAADPSYMSPVSFPSAGCWRLRARVGDVSLVYVVRVVVADENPRPR
jgi:hypothetical protein